MPEQNNEIANRAFWSGTITFGLVSIPVGLFPANRGHRVSLRMVDDTGTPLSRLYFCPKDEQPIPRDEIVRGYPIEKDKFVVVDDEELEALEPRKTRDIDLRRFVPQEQVDPIYFERSYFLMPATESTKAYKLLAATMQDLKRAGIATFVMRGKEYLVAIFAENGVLRAETLRFHDEIRAPSDIGLPEPGEVDEKAAKRIAAEIRKLNESRLSTAELKDRSAERILSLVKKKEKKGEDVYEAPAEAEEEEEETSVIDLMEVLRRSLEQKKPKRTAAKRSATKRSVRKTAGKTSARKKTTRRKSARKSA